MTSNKVKLFCILDGDSSAFEVKLDADDSIAALKKAIKKEKEPEFDDIAADKLNLWLVSLPSAPKRQIALNNLTANEESRKKPEELEDSTCEISDVFGAAPPKKTIHIIVQRPLAGAHSLPAVQAPQSSRLSLSPPPSRPTSPSQDLETTIKKITASFFASDSPAVVFLNEYVKGTRMPPLTTEVITGLPRVWRRGKTTAPDSRPNFLFLDLPTPSTENIPERFKSNVILQELERTESQDVPVFGVSGCGKTRSVVEMLCLQWGFYFNASDKDLGSDDLSYLATSILVKTRDGLGRKHNTDFARNMTLLLFLSRLMILNYCLSIPGCERTFSSSRWAILQVCPTMFEDVFMSLFKILFGRLQEHTISELSLTAVVSEELLSVRSHLASLSYPNFTKKSKLRLVVDEAQILGDQGYNLFESSYVESELRPLLSPVLHGFRRPGDRGELTIIYCGTGLSIRTLHWAQSSGDGVKEEGSMTFPYLEFPGWTSQTSVQSFIDRVKDQLPNDESKNAVDALLPEEAVSALYQRLGGRFRPICTAIEGIIRTGNPNKWESIIDDTESMLTSWKEKERRGNLISELLRVQSKIAKHQEQFKSCSNIEETLELFLFRWYLLGETEFILEDDAQLVEAAFGRIRILGNKAITTLDEPFVLRAAKNYFMEKDPLFIKAAERAMITSTNASVHGTMWETCMPPVFIETFRAMPLSKWPLPSGNSIPEELRGDVTIVGYNKQEQLAITYHDISTHGFMEAHVNGNSMRGDKSIPPFYFPSPRVSGPDIIFIVSVNGKKIPIFVQLKLRVRLPLVDAEAALATTSDEYMQEKINKEHQKEQISKKGTAASEPPSLQDLCPSGVYISMIIAYPAEVIRFQRPDPDPELGSNPSQGLKRVVINVDDSNFGAIFPARHVRFLDKLKKFKRRAEVDEEPSPSKKAHLRKSNTNDL